MAMKIDDLTYEELDFRHGAILTKSMLDVMDGYPREFLALQYANFGDGILCGCDYQAKPVVAENATEHIILSPGIVKWQGKYFFIHEEINLSEQISHCCKAFGNREVIFGLQHKEDMGKVKMVFVAVDEESIDIELGRFSYEQDTLPRLAKKKIDATIDFSPLYVPYACAGGTTFPPYVFRSICEKLQKKSTKHMYDFQLLMTLRSLSAVPLNVLETYIAAVGIPFSGGDRRTLLSYLERAMEKELKFESMLRVDKTETGEDDTDDDEPFLLS